MRLRLIIVLTLITPLDSFATILQTKTAATASASQNTPQVKRKPIQPDLPGTVSGATNPDAIPDTIAYELFMRSVGDYPSEYVFKDSGLNGDQIAGLLSYVRTFEMVIGALDHAARQIKGARRGTEKLAQLQKQKEQFLDRELNHYLPLNLGAEGANRIRSFINGRVKPKTKKLPTSIAKKSGVNERELPSRSGSSPLHHPSATMPSNGVYAYTNAWRDGENVYGSGTLSSDYSDYN